MTREISPRVIPTLRVLAAIAVVGTLSGCPRASGSETIALPLVTTSDAAAEAEMQLARDAFDAGRTEEARQRFRRFLDQFPADPLAVVAELGLGQLALAEGELEEASTRFASVATHPDELMSRRGQLYAGVTLHMQGESEGSLAALKPFVGRTIDPAETSLLLRTVAAASRAVGRRDEALVALDRLIRSNAPEPDKAEAREAVEDLVVAATSDEIQSAASELPIEGYAWPLVAKRAVAEAFEAGDLERVRALATALEEHNIPLDDELRELALRAERNQETDPKAIGALLPLSGRGREVGQLALQGLLLSAGAPSLGAPTADETRIVFRDTAGDATRARNAVDELVSLHRVIAIVGPLSGPTAEAAGTRARELGVPLISLSPIVSSEDSDAYRMLPSPTTEASALANEAIRTGARKLAVLHPESAYGQAMRAAFVEAAREAGATITGEVSYPPDATSFGPTVERLAQLEFDALFLPDRGRKVALIAPALAVAGLESRARRRPTATRRRDAEREVLLLLPSAAFDRTLLPSAGRYLEGALMSLPFSAETAVGSAAAFVQRFETRFGRTPDLFAASAYDAAEVIRGAVNAGAMTRDELAAELARLPEVDTAGPSRGFGPDRGPRVGTRILEIADGELVSHRAR